MHGAQHLKLASRDQVSSLVIVRHFFVFVFFHEVSELPSVSWRPSQHNPDGSLVSQRANEAHRNMEGGGRWECALLSTIVLSPNNFRPTRFYEIISF